MLWLLLLTFTNDAHAGKRKACWVPGKLPYIGKTVLEYIPHAEALAAEQKRASLEMRELAPIPANGIIKVQVERDKIERADPSIQIVVLLDASGSELLRFEPEKQVPNTPENVYKHWWSVFAAPVPAGELPIAVHVVDRVAAHKCLFKLESTGKVRLEKGG